MEKISERKVVVERNEGGKKPYNHNWINKVIKQMKSK
jgi:hypothetical protein